MLEIWVRIPAPMNLVFVHGQGVVKTNYVMDFFHDGH